jgi:hypothetical protein
MNRPPIKDKAVLAYVQYLENQLSSPFADSYLAIKKIVDKGNDQLINTEIDIFDSDDEKKSSMVQKYISQLKTYSEQMIYFKSKMTGEEIIEADKKAKEKVVKAEGVEEYLRSKE